MKTTEEQKKRTKRFEGLRLKAYPDGNGNMTIGYGHKMKRQNQMHTISFKDAEEIFKHDINIVEEQVTGLKLGLNQNQFDAICDFVFNLGISKFTHSTLYKLILKNKDDIEIAREFMMWVCINHKISKGLKKRREVEYLTYFTWKIFDTKDIQ